MTPARAVFVACAAALVGCAGNEPQPRIDAVYPAQAYTGRDIRLKLTGAGFVPSFRLDPGSGERVATMQGFSGQVSQTTKSAPLTDFGWASPTQISADLDIQDPDDFTAGPCDVEITDPRGRRAALATGFSLLGRYTFAPVLTVTSPAAGGDPYAPGSTIHAEVTATDGPPGHLATLRWTYTEPPAEDGSQRDPVTGNCPSALRSDRIDCIFDVTISPGLQPGMTVNLSIVALDNSVPPYQSSPVGVTIDLSQPPTVFSVTPQSGGVAGGTNVVIRGSGLLAGSRAYFGDNPLIPDGGIVVDKQTITGYTPAYSSAVAVSVTVQSRLGSATWARKFQYQFPPQIRSIAPASGPPGTPVKVYGARFTEATIIYLGPTLASAAGLASVAWIGTGEIDGVVPPGNGQATVWAFDPANGWTSLPDGFTWIAP